MAATPADGATAPSDPWSDLVLTLPMFIGYHLGVIFLPIRNAADIVTRELVALAGHDRTAYGGLTLAIGLAFVVVLGLAGRGHALRWQRFALIAFEGIAYAVAMRIVAGYVVGRVFLGPELPGQQLVGQQLPGPFSGVVMSLGAGFYEELVFRVGLFGGGRRVLGMFFPGTTMARRTLLPLGWAVVTAGLFSAWHHFGQLGEPFEAQPFIFRWVCGLVFVVIYAMRGFAPVVWTHAVYDLWVLVF